MTGSTTITTASTRGIERGDRIAVSTEDRRWWIRLWRALTFRGPAYRTEYYSVTGAHSGSVLTIEPPSGEPEIPPNRKQRRSKRHG